MVFAIPNLSTDTNPHTNAGDDPERAQALADLYAVAAALQAQLSANDADDAGTAVGAEDPRARAAREALGARDRLLDEAERQRGLREQTLAALEEVLGEYTAEEDAITAEQNVAARQRSQRARLAEQIEQTRADLRIAARVKDSEGQRQAETQLASLTAQQEASERKIAAWEAGAAERDQAHAKRLHALGDTVAAHRATIKRANADAEASERRAAEHWAEAGVLALARWQDTLIEREAAIGASDTQASDARRRLARSRALARSDLQPWRKSNPQVRVWLAAMTDGERRAEKPELALLTAYRRWLDALEQVAGKVVGYTRLVENVALSPAVMWELLGGGVSAASIVRDRRDEAATLTAIITDEMSRQAREGME